MTQREGDERWLCFRLFGAPPPSAIQATGVIMVQLPKSWLSASVVNILSLQPVSASKVIVAEPVRVYRHLHNPFNNLLRSPWLGNPGSSSLLAKEGAGSCSSAIPFINRTLLNTLLQSYRLDEDTRLKAVAIPDGVINLYHIIKADDGTTARNLIASLPQSFVLGSTASSSSDPDELDGPAMWEIGLKDEILTKAWMPLIRQQPPRNVAECERVAELSGRFCYLAIIFDPTEVVSDARAYGTMISTEELRHVVEERGKWETRFTVTDHGDGTNHIVLDEEGMTLRQVLAGIDGDIEMGRFV